MEFLQEYSLPCQQENAYQKHLSPITISLNMQKSALSYTEKKIKYLRGSARHSWRVSVPLLSRCKVLVNRKFSCLNMRCLQEKVYKDVSW